MRRVAYSTVLAGVCARLGWRADDLDEKEFADARQAISTALAEIQEATWWNDVMRIERRTFRDPWDSTLTYAASDEVYHPASDAYYQALQASTGEDPATADGAGGWTTNLDYWAEATTAPEGDDWDSDTAYEIGAIVRNPSDGLHYQAHTASLGAEPPDSAAWGVLNAFVPYIPWEQLDQNRIGEVRRVTIEDPRVTPNPTALGWDKHPSGVLLFDLGTPRPWIEFRLPSPRLTGDPWDSTVAYTAVPSEGGLVVDSLEATRARHAILGWAALAALVRHEANEVQYLKYLNTDGDGMGGEFIFSATSTTTHDAIDTIRPTNVAASDPGRWIRSNNP